MPSLIIFDDAPATVQYLGSDFTIGLSNLYSFPMPLGDAAGSRRIVVGVAYMQALPVGGPVTGVTVGGVTASLVRGEPAGSMWIADVPLGTFGNIDVICGGGQQCAVAAWRLTRLRSSVPTDTDFMGSAASPSPSTVDVSVSKRGVAVGITFLNSVNNTVWAGLPEDFDILNGSGNICLSGASAAFNTAQSPLTVTSTKGGTVRPNLIVAAFR